MIEEPFSLYYNVFDSSIYSAATLYVPVGTIDAYQATDGWKNFKNIEEILDSGYQKGDANHDNVINVADIAQIIDLMAGCDCIPSDEADVNNDGAVDVADIAAIITIMAEMR